MSSIPAFRVQAVHGLSGAGGGSVSLDVHGAPEWRTPLGAASVLMMRFFLLLLPLITACPQVGQPGERPPAILPPPEPFCGDGIVDRGEDCDDGNDDPKDLCGNDCRISRCGDGVLGVGEECDDGDDDPSDACHECRSTFCGDGQLQGGEGCDDGNEVETDACLVNCQPAVCGDGVHRLDASEGEPGYEACDDGDDDPRDQCTNRCQEARCGDGILRADLFPDQPGYEACDDGNDITDDGCEPNCRFSALPRCGDGEVQFGEECDDGNRNNNDGCTNGCEEARCGDGIVRVGLAADEPGYEACEDLDDNDFNGCTNACRFARCGDGILRRDLPPDDPQFEECDDGDDADDDACVESCLDARCGDGFHHIDEEDCDDGNVTNSDACLTNCVSARCGDGFLHEGVEDCDDANDENEDACQNDCRLNVPNILPLNEYSQRRSFFDGQTNSTMGIAWDGDAFYSCSGGDEYGERLSRYGFDGTHEGRLLAGLDFRSVFTRVDGEPPLLMRAHQQRQIRRWMGAGENEVEVSLVGGDLDPQSAVVFDTHRQEYVARAGATIHRWNSEGQYQGTVTLQGFGDEDRETNYPQSRSLFARASFYFTYSNGYLSAWTDEGERFRRVRLVDAGTSMDSHFSLSYAAGHVWIVDAAGSRWRGYDLGLP
ncbi:MAG: hypothetical protein CMH58_05495 [Myxococcales bacterium]|nr:hypothetical protein [Myxococcales bacterium]